MTLDPAAPLMRLILGGMASQVTRALVVLGVADALGERERATEDVASELGLHGPSTARLLHAAATLELTEAAPGGWRLTALGRRLRTGEPGGLAAVASLYGGEQFWTTNAGLADSIRAGRTAISLQADAGISFDLYARDPILAAQFNTAMTALSDLIGPAVARAYPFAGLVVDVGAGHGRLLAHILAAHPEARGVVFDLPKVAAGAPAVLAALGVADRCQVAEGDMFEAVPAGGDIYLLSAVIHDWNDADSIRILRACRRAMGADARLVLVERVLADTPGADASDQTDALTDLTMMIRNGGQERTEGAYRTLLAEAGFELLRVIPTGAPRQVIEARGA